MTGGRLLGIGLACLVLMGGTAAVLARLRGGQRLGEPGLRLVEVPLADEKGVLVTTNSIFLPERLLDFQSELLPVTRVEYDWLPRDTTYGRRMYRAEDGFQIQVSGVLMGTDRTSIHKPEYCLPGQGFQIQRQSQRIIPIQSPHRYQLPVMRMDALREVQLPDGKVERLGAVYVYWFLSDTRLSNDHAQRMWWLALDLLKTGELQRWAYMGCLAACYPGQEDATYARLERFIQALVPEFQLTTGPAVGAADPAIATGSPQDVSAVLLSPTGRVGAPVEMSGGRIER